MSYEFQNLVDIFNKAMGADLTNLQKTIDLRIKLIDEEVEETVSAIEKQDVVETIDGLCDVLYVTYGAACVFNIPLDTQDKEHQPIAKKIDWPIINNSVTGFIYSANDAMRAIRIQQPKAMQIRLQELADGCWDCAAQGIGIDLQPFFREVHRTNMNKLNGPKREGDGKQLKPVDWLPPRISAMYNRTLVGNKPECTGMHSYWYDEKPLLKTFILKHPNGGNFCELCGGLVVEID